jgi:hypothetical protein
VARTHANRYCDLESVLRRILCIAQYISARRRGCRSRAAAGS